MRVHLLIVPALALLLAACGAPVQPPADAGHFPAPDAGLSDGGTTDGGPWDIAVDYAIDDAEPITAPNETWTFVSVPESRCGNGTPTGFGVNLTDRSDRLLIILAGGGACWEAAACAAGTTVNLQTTMGEAQVLGEAQHANLSSVFDRSNPDNPFRDANFVYIAYCTGDLHSGTQVYTYDWFGPKDVHHVGANNMHHFLRHIRATFKDADRVWLGGASAGGFGATFHWWRVQKAMPWARVDVFNDSAQIIDLSGDGRWGTLKNRWEPAFPPGCTDCGTKLSELLDYSAELLPAPRRYGLLGYTRDGTIALFWGLNQDQVETRTLALKADAPDNVKTFLIQSDQHVMYTTPNVTNSTGMSAREWSQLFAGEDGNGWDHSGP